MNDDTLFPCRCCGEIPCAEVRYTEFRDASPFITPCSCFHTDTILFTLFNLEPHKQVEKFIERWQARNEKHNPFRNVKND